MEILKTGDYLGPLGVLVQGAAALLVFQPELSFTPDYNIRWSGLVIGESGPVILSLVFC